ncbi:MAG: hypothetical protein NDJ72_13555, partial [Elusimicrobia bacterium]|nr:hypothetical protein [Elusimicrobiota bacterium]
MKTLKPLAAALLLLASPAAAQLLAGPSGGGFNFGGTGSLASQAAPVTDFTFRCGTPPWKACTDVEMNQRQAILIARKCPAPVSNACSSWLIANTDAGAIEWLGNNPDVQWEDPVHCNFIPCRTVNSPAGPAAAPAPAPRPVAASSSY